MTNFEKTQNRQKNSADIIAKIKTARDQARIKANAYRNLTAMEYKYWRATAELNAYNQVLAMFEKGTEQQIPGMAATAIAEFERARDDDTNKWILALAEGRKDALASVTDWMNNKENN